MAGCRALRTVVRSTLRPLEAEPAPKGGRGGRSRGGGRVSARRRGAQVARALLARQTRASPRAYAGARAGADAPPRHESVYAESVGDAAHDTTSDEYQQT